MAESLFQAEWVADGEATLIGTPSNAADAEESLIDRIVRDAQEAKAIGTPDDLGTLDDAEVLARARIRFSGYPLYGPWELDFPPLKGTYRIIELLPPKETHREDRLASGSDQEPTRRVQHITVQNGDGVDASTRRALTEAFERALNPVVPLPSEPRDGDAPLQMVVVRKAGYAVDIFADEHPPPHFRVSKGGESANFAIATGGRLPKQRGLETIKRDVQRVWKQYRCRIATVWNERRPSDCQVGAFDIPADWDC